MVWQRLLLPSTRRGRLALGISVSAGTAAGALVMGQAWLLATVLADAMEQAPVAWRVIAWLVATAAVRALAVWLADSAAAWAGVEVRLALRRRAWNAVLERGPAFTTRERSGELAHTVTLGIESTDAYTSQYVPHAMLAVVVPALVLVAVAGVDPLSALVLVATGPLIPVFMVLIGRSASAQTRQQWRALSLASSRFLDAVQGLGTLRVIQGVDDERRIIEATSERVRSTTMGVLRTAFLSALALEALATLSTAVVAVEVGLRVLYGRLEYQPALFVLLLAPEFYRPLRTLGASFHASMTGGEVAERVEQVIEPNPAPPCAQGAAARSAARPGGGLPARQPAHLHIERVTCRYPGASRDALHALSFDVEPGALLAVVGPSGAGKSTVLQVLLRFVEPTDGRILLDGRPLDTIAPREWRTRVAWVPQQPHLFAGTVRDNLKLARPDARASEIDRALERSGMAAVLDRLPRGLDTPVGELGARLSGGQLQHLALARALVRATPYLLLDEPTAHLDPTSERAVLAGLRDLRGQTTVILVTHRLTASLIADDILVMSAGTAVESGHHRNLMAGGCYARMMAAWTETP